MIFCILILCVAFPQKYSAKILSWIAVFTVVAALGLYGYGYSDYYLGNEKDPKFLTYVLRTVFDSCRIFVGANNWDKIKGAYTDPGWELFFWTVHLLAMTTSVSAIIVSLGSKMLKWLRIKIYKMRDIALIFGLSENTLEFGRQLMEKAEYALIYVDESGQPTMQKAVDQMGALLRTDTDALSGNVKFLKSIGLKSGKRKFHVYALDSSMIANQQYSNRLLKALQERGVTPEQTTLTILHAGDETENPLQAVEGRYGYGSLISINEPDMVARILVRNYPPCKVMAFDPEGKATRDFHGVIIGFGRIGQAVLKQLVMNSQFSGGTSRIAVFAPDYEKRIGWLFHECPEMFKHYPIFLNPYDGRSDQLYNYLEENIGSINYIAICAGGEIMNMEIGEQLQTFLNRRNCTAPILMCSHKGVFHHSGEEVVTSHPIYTPELLCSDRIDRMAKVLNQSYMDKGDMEENWKNCNYFNRMSSRAAADFYVYCAGVTEEEALRHWEPRGALLENLSESEHLRWNAFHYCMGFRPMTEEEFRDRSRIYLEEKKKDPTTRYRIGKDMDKRIHACMIPWEALDAYSEKENAVTGGGQDYGENDRKNVRDIRKILLAMK